MKSFSRLVICKNYLGLDLFDHWSSWIHFSDSSMENLSGFNLLLQVFVAIMIKQHAHAEIVTVTDADLIQIVLVWCRL